MQHQGPGARASNLEKSRGLERSMSEAGMNRSSKSLLYNFLHRPACSIIMHLSTCCPRSSSPLTGRGWGFDQHEIKCLSPSLVPSLFIARGRVWWNAYSILVPIEHTWRVVTFAQQHYSRLHYNSRKQSRAFRLAQTSTMVHLAKLKWWVASSIACWSGDQPSLSSFKSLSQSIFKHAHDIGTVLQSDWPHPELAARNQNRIRASPDSFSVCDKRGWARDYLSLGANIMIKSWSPLGLYICKYWWNSP